MVHLFSLLSSTIHFTDKKAKGWVSLCSRSHTVNGKAGNTKALQLCSWFGTVCSFSVHAALRFVYMQTIQRYEQSQLWSLTQILNPKDHFNPLAPKISVANMDEKMLMAPLSPIIQTSLILCASFLAPSLSFLFYHSLLLVSRTVSSTYEYSAANSGGQ